MTSESNDFITKQQTKVDKNIKQWKDKSGFQQKDKWTAGKPEVNNVKNVFIYDEWETYTIKFSIFEPFDDPKIDVRL